MPKIFHWSNGFSSGGGPNFLRGYVGSVLEVEGLAESIHALLEQKTLFAHFTPNCGAQMVPVLKGVYQAESGEARTPHSFRVGRNASTEVVVKKSVL